MAETKQIIIPELNQKGLEVALIGDSMLVVHKQSEKAKKMIEDKQQQKVKSPRKARDPEQEYRDSFHYIKNGKKPIYGFPAGGFKAAMIRAGKQVGLKMVDTQTYFRVIGHPDCPDLVEIKGEPVMRSDWVRIGIGTGDIRYRPEFTKWSAKLRIIYDADLISAEQLINLVNRAGFGVGIGENRPGKCATGQWGTFHVASDEEMKNL